MFAVLILSAITYIPWATAVRTQQAEAQAQRSAPENPLSIYREGYSLRWLEDRDFLYGPALLDFDLKAFLASNAPHILPYADFISHWCGYYSVSPKVILTIMEMRTEIISKNVAGQAIQNPLAGLVAGSGFEEQVRNMLAALYADFYTYRNAVQNTRGTISLNSASFALLNVFRGSSTPVAFASSAELVRGRFNETYSRLFPSTPKRALADTQDLPTIPLQLPWKNGDSWYFNGVHTQTGMDPGVLSSIDFTRTWTLKWGDDTSKDFVVAAHDGTVTVFSTCSMRVTSPSGWATNYYHLDGVIATSGEQVTANQTIAIYANSLDQAVCQGGFSSGPHVHFSLLNNGAYTALDGTTLSGYVVHSGRFSYDSDPSFMWLESSGVRYYAFAQAILSTPPVLAKKVRGQLISD
jgi:LasA protease